MKSPKKCIWTEYRRGIEIDVCILLINLFSKQMSHTDAVHTIVWECERNSSLICDVETRCLEQKINMYEAIKSSVTKNIPKS